MSKPLKAGFAVLVSLAFAIAPIHGQAAPRPHYRLLPNKITSRYFEQNARERTAVLESNHNDQLDLAERAGAAMHGRPAQYAPVVLSQERITWRGLQGQVQAIAVRVLGTTDFGRDFVTSVYTYTYDARTGALLQESAKPADRALALRYHFPPSSFKDKK